MYPITKPVLLSSFVEDFAQALKSIDSRGDICKNYLPGIGPFGEAEAIKRALELMRQTDQVQYQFASAPSKYPNSSKQCDLVIPGQWAMEFKLVRPFHNNGNEAEHWSENVLHPYSSKSYGSISAITDGLKLRDSGWLYNRSCVI